MRGNFVTSLAVVCLLGAAVTGCVSTQATDVTSNPGDSFALMGSASGQQPASYDFGQGALGLIQ